jgi:hypothetical protein
VVSALAIGADVTEVAPVTAIAAGPDAVSWLAGLDLARCGQSLRLEALALLRRQHAWEAALEAQLLATFQADAVVAAADPDDREWLSEEVGAVLRLRADFAKNRMVTAHQLVVRLPSTLARLRDGSVTPMQARILAEAVVGLSDDAASTVEARVLPRAEDQTSTQFRRSVTRAIIAVDPRTADEAHRDAVADRRVSLIPAPNGMAILWALLPVAEAMRLKTAIWRLAYTRRNEQPDKIDGSECASTGGRGLRLDQLRADALIELGDRYLSEPSPPGARTRRLAPTVQVIVSLSTLTGDSDEPGELAGYGPIPPQLARLIAAEPGGTWHRLVTDPVGRLIDLSTKRYRPPKRLADHVRARDQTCVFPSCNRRADACEIDHTIPWNLGPTAEHNLAPLCVRHHHLKHEGDWSYARGPDGTYDWISRNRRSYRKARPG